ncbi:Inosine-uridine preferring nucleoside hydrolase [Acidisarcina polymorpha]|uniref:Inosine-uridine preferring nucleoside hydrolase n=1 Tax=Acidisarcina polymorpha TaxID=2211140 RepID=A0A2Z5G5W8_9BACT|nr:nucleoside hydrolase [Acidisarcina polymorpha]AXC13946.1 Inosine-uridine preferring nucleoside hydrolase [Acidisarcina polymorpha]
MRLISCASQALGIILPLLFLLTTGAAAQASKETIHAPAGHGEPVIFDTDIGDDIDDVLALGLVISSRELHLVGVTTAWGDTALRARMVDRLFLECGLNGVPVLKGPEKHHSGEAAFSQSGWAKRGPAHTHDDAVQFLLTQAQLHPNEITLISVGPMSNLGAAIDRDPVTFKQFKRIVLMGGSVRRGYGDFGYTNSHHIDAEYNIAMDPESAAKVFRSGVPLYVMPVDSTQIKLGELQRELLFTHSTPLTDALTLNYQQWSHTTKQQTPTMYDAMAVAFAIDPKLCPVTPLHLIVDAKGFTRETAGPPNAQVCLDSDSDQFFRFYIPRLLGSQNEGQP